MNHLNKAKFINLISGVLKTPGLFQVNRIEDLDLIITGYKCAVNEVELEDFIADFRAYVNKRFESSEDVHWVRWIRFRAASDMHSLELGKSVFSEFIQDNCPNLLEIKHK